MPLQVIPPLPPPANPTLFILPRHVARRGVGAMRRPQVPVHVLVAGGEVGAACAGRAGDLGVVGDEVFSRGVLARCSEGTGKEGEWKGTSLYPSRVLKGFVFLEVHFGCWQMKGGPGGLVRGCWAILEGEGLGVGCWVGGDGVVKMGESYEGQWAGVGMGESQGGSVE